MKVFKAVLAVILLIPTFFAGKAAIHQFEHYQEWWSEYYTPFHGFNIVVLTLIAVAFLALAGSVLLVDEDAEGPEEWTVSLSDYIRSVLFGTAGVIAIGIGWYEEEVNTGEVYPYLAHRVYHGGDSLLVFVTGAVLVMIGIYYLCRGGRQSSNREVRNPAASGNGEPSPEKPADGPSLAAQPAPEETPQPAGDYYDITVFEIVLPEPKEADAFNNNVEGEAVLQIDGETVNIRCRGKVEDVTFFIMQLLDSIFPEEKPEAPSASSAT